MHRKDECIKRNLMVAREVAERTMSIPSSSFYSCIFLDATARQAASAVCLSFKQLLRPSGSYHRRSIRTCEKLFGDSAVMCLSARTAFDALLTVRQFPKGSHVIMSGALPACCRSPPPLSVSPSASPLHVCSRVPCSNQHS